MLKYLEHKIKKIILPNFEIGEDYNNLIINFLHLAETMTVVVFALLLLFEYIFPSGNDTLPLFILGLIFSLIIRLINYKHINLKINLFSIMLFCICILATITVGYYYIWYYIFIIYISFHKNTLVSISSLIISTLAIIIINNIYPKANTEYFHLPYNLLLPRLIIIFFLVSLGSVILYRVFVEFLKQNVDETQMKTMDVFKEKEKQKALNKQLLTEAKIREEIQDNLVKSRERLKTIFDNVSDSILIHNDEGKIIEVNETGIEKYGFDKDNLSSYNYFDYIANSFKDKVPERINQIKLQGYSKFETIHIDKDGNEFYTENKIKYIKFDGESYFINISRDITDRVNKEKESEAAKNELKRMVEERTAQLEDAMYELRAEIDDKIKTEQELIKTKDELINSLEIEREYSDLKTRFVSMISHEYRTPLTVILSSTYILEHFFNNQDKEKFNQNILKIQNSVQSMTNLLEDVIRIGKSENQLSKVSFNKFDLVATIYDIITEIKFIEKTSHNYEFICKYKSMVINSDEKLHSHIIRNIVHNASKYSEKDTTIKVSVYLFNEVLNIVISDEGIGIPEDDLKHLFEPFFRSGNVGAREGTGLGLALTKKYVEALKGEILIESQENKGTTIKIKYPLTEFTVKE